MVVSGSKFWNIISFYFGLFLSLLFDFWFVLDLIWFFFELFLILFLNDLVFFYKELKMIDSCSLLYESYINYFFFFDWF